MKIVDVSSKFKTKRSATAKGSIRLKKETIQLIREGKIPKGNVIEASKITALYSVKVTELLLPFCHKVNIDSMEVSLKIKEESIEVEVTVSGVERTGYEMEALTAVSFALLNIYDMCKNIDSSMAIENIMIVEKRGGKQEYLYDPKSIEIYFITNKNYNFENFAQYKVLKLNTTEYENLRERKAIFVTFYNEVPEGFIEARLEGLESLISSHMFEMLGTKGVLSPIIGFTSRGIGIILLSQEKEYIAAVFNDIMPLIVKVFKENL